MYAPVSSSASLDKYTRNAAVMNSNHLVSSTVVGESDKYLLHIRDIHEIQNTKSGYSKSASLYIYYM